MFLPDGAPDGMGWSRAAVLAPALHWHVDAEQLEAARGAVVDQLDNRVGPQVQSLHGRSRDGPCFGGERGRAAVREAQRRLSEHQDQPPPLLERDVGRAREQVGAEGRARSWPAYEPRRGR